MRLFRVIPSVILIGAATVLLSAFGLEAILAWDNRTRITMSDADVAEYAATARARIAGEELQLPFVALPDYRCLNPVIRLADQPAKPGLRTKKEAFVAAASDPAHPVDVASLPVVIDLYGSLGELAKSARICPRLQREWASAICLDARHPLQQSLPNRFYLFDAGASEADWRMPERHKRLLGSLVPLGPEPKTACEEVAGNRYCLAAALITGKLAAAWKSHDRAGEEVPHATDGEGRILRAFVEFALGEEEDFASLLQAAHDLRNFGQGRPVDYPDPCAD